MTPDDQLRLWREAIAARRRQQRNQRGRRRRDPWARAQPVIIKQPPKREEQT